MILLRFYISHSSIHVCIQEADHVPGAVLQQRNEPSSSPQRCTVSRGRKKCQVVTTQDHTCHCGRGMRCRGSPWHRDSFPENRTVKLRAAGRKSSAKTRSREEKDLGREKPLHAAQRGGNTRRVCRTESTHLRNTGAMRGICCKANGRLRPPNPLKEDDSVWFLIFIIHRGNWFLILASLIYQFLRGIFLFASSGYLTSSCVVLLFPQCLFLPNSLLYSIDNILSKFSIVIVISTFWLVYNFLSSLYYF